MKYVRLAAALAATFATCAATAQESRPAQPRPVLQALDADHDGTLSPAEIANAPTALRGLDRNNDGQLDSFEYLGRQPNEASTEADDIAARLLALDKNGDGFLTADELPERLRSLIAKADTDHDGKLSAGEVRAYARTQAQSQPQGRQQRGGQATRMDPILNALDTDHDGILSAAEIAAAPTTLLTLDRNADGQLTLDELRPRPQTVEDRVSHLLDEWDTDKDGKLTKAEMPDRLQAIFEQIDTNHDGFADKAELLVWFQNNQQMQRAPRP